MTETNQENFLGSGVSRKFYDLKGAKTDDLSAAGIDVRVHEGPDKFTSDGQSNLLSFINDNVSGEDKVFSGPFGLRKVTYCDYTASGRSLEFLEDYIRKEVLPEYGNTHTTTTVTSLQTTLFRHEARDIVRNAVNASEHDAVIFVGSGCTAAVHKLIHALHLKEAPVVFVGPYEHHSNLLPWRELGSKIIRIAENADGSVDLQNLEDHLKEYEKSGRKLIGCFAAASNVTGTLVDVDAVTVCLHRHGALAFWDYATAGPYVNINMNPVTDSADQSFVNKDAIFISPHKFVGGVQTPGLLIAKKSLFVNPVPSGCGGGSVFFVRRDSHRYLQEAEMREEGGTPSIVESIRAGLVFQLKEAIGIDLIMQKEHLLSQKVKQSWDNIDNLKILGNLDLPHLPIYSFMIRHPQTGLYLHHNFVCALLNDLFGIQARGGCACAGPYAEDLMGINESLAMEIEEALAEDKRLDRVHLRRYYEYSEREILRPGFARLNFPYFMEESSINFVLEAVKMVATEGWKMLPQYKFNPETGEWRHRNHQVFKDRKWLGHISYKSGTMSYRQPAAVVKGPLPENYAECIDKARECFRACYKGQVQIADQTAMFDNSIKHLRWFLLPSEARDCLQNPNWSTKSFISSPFNPVSFPRDSYVHRRFNSEPRMAQFQKDRDTDNRDSSDTYEEGIRSQLESGFETCDTATSKISSKSSDNSLDQANTQTEPQTQMEVVSTSASPLPDNRKSASEEGKKDNIDKGTHTREDKSSRVPDRINPVCPDGACVKKRKIENDAGKPEKTSKIIQKWHSPPKSIFKPCLDALHEYSMIQDKDRVLVCLSGGKDSLSLLHALRQYQFYAKKKGVEFALGAITVDPQTASYDPSPLKQYLQQLGVPYFYEEQCIMEQAQNLPYECASICSFCSRMKRGRIYAAARREKYNVLALGQHLDDLAESFLMSVFHNGILRTMKANYTVQEGDLRVIRPLVYVREKDTRQFAETKKLPVIAENCPACFEAPKERHRIKQMLASQEVVHPRLFHSLLAAMKPILGINKTGMNIQGLISQLTQNSHGEDEDIDQI